MEVTVSFPTILRISVQVRTVFPDFAMLHTASAMVETAIRKQRNQTFTQDQLVRMLNDCLRRAQIMKKHKGHPILTPLDRLLFTSTVLQDSNLQRNAQPHDHQRFIAEVNSAMQ